MPLLFKNRRDTCIAMLFGMLFSYSNLVGMYLEQDAAAARPYLILELFGAAVVGLLAAELYLHLKQYLTHKPERPQNFSISRRDSIRYMLLCTLILSFSYFIVFLAYYPGIFGYDVANQIRQYEKGYSSMHPLVHTLYLQFFYYGIGGRLLHSYTKGIACATIVQIIIFSMMLSYLHLFLKKVNVNRAVRVCLLFFSACFPFFSMLAISMTKDTFFAGAVSILAVCLCQWDYCSWCKTKIQMERSSKIVYVLSIAGVILLRKNGIYAVVLSALGGLYLLVYKRKNYEYLRCTLYGLLLGLVCSTVLQVGLLADKGPKNEALSIPYQQIASVYSNCGDSLSKEDSDSVNLLVPNAGKYNPYVADPVKDNALGTTDPKGFLSLWTRLFVSYPVEYIKAFLSNNLGYFYIGDKTHAEIYGSTMEGRQGYLLSDTKDGFDVVHTTYLPVLENLYENLFTINKYQHNFVLRLFCSPATYFWIIVMLFFLTADLGIPVGSLWLFVLGLLVTVLLGPCVLIRYALPYIVCVPVLSLTMRPAAYAGCDDR